jgi:L,D-transpeptidase catalytic domain
MRLYLLVLVLSSVTAAWFIKIKTNNTNAANPPKPTTAAHAATVALKRLKLYSSSAKPFTKKNGFDTSLCFLVDMKLPCGSNRFFVFDMGKDSVLNSGLVTHGYGKSSGFKVSFSNVPGSNSSSLGKYKIGASYNGRFGLAFKLHGLDSTNSSAFNRYVVLHSHACVPSAKVSPQTICMSQGCPTVSPVFFSALKNYIEKCEKPVLLWIYY